MELIVEKSWHAAARDNLCAVIKLSPYFLWATEYRAHGTIHRNGSGSVQKLLERLNGRHFASTCVS